MNSSEDKMEEYVSLLTRHAPDDGYFQTSIPELIAFRESEPYSRKSTIYEPAIVILGQGKKYCHVGGKKFDFSTGQFLSLMLPMPVQAEVVEASSEKAILMAGLRVNLDKITNILLKLDKVAQQPELLDPADSSAIFTDSLPDSVIEIIIKLFHTLDNPVEQAVLADSLLEQIYYRLYCNGRLHSLQYLIQQQAHIQQISTAIDYIHQNLDKPISVEQLAEMAHMSRATFYERFKAVMQMSPLQYAKSMKLFQAQRFIREGKNASEAGYLVGYNSPAQFSREYKRHFGYAPSATVSLN